MNIVEFMKNLFLCMLFLTGIIVCFFFIVNFITKLFEKEEKSKVKINAVNMSDLDLDEETKKSLDKIAEKLAKKYVEEMTSDDYEKED